MFKKSFVFLVSALMIIGFISFFPIFPSSANVTIVQTNCSVKSNLANNTNYQVSLASLPIVGHMLLVGASVSGSGNTAINGVNITDNNGGSSPYSLIGRTLDQGNTLYVAWFNRTVTSNSNNPYLINSKYNERSGISNQNLQVCIYELIVSNDFSFFHFHTIQGGSIPTDCTTQGAVAADLVFAGCVYNSSPLGTGHQIAYNGTDDSALQSNFSDFGHSNGGGQFNFVSGASTVAFAMGADVKFQSLTVTATSTVTGWLIPNFANNQNTFNWFYLIIVVFIPFGVIDMVLFMGGRLTAKIFTFFMLLGLALGATFGSMLTLTPVALIPIFWGVFIIYIWRFRG